jgi:hypothetical protein
MVGLEISPTFSLQTHTLLEKLKQAFAPLARLSINA